MSAAADSAGPSNVLLLAPGDQRHFGLACTECRRSKLRCTDNEGCTMPCKRCRRRGTVCDFSTTKRGPRLDPPRSSLPPVSQNASSSRTFAPSNPQPSGAMSSPISHSSAPAQNLDHMVPGVDTSTYRASSEDAYRGRRLSPKANTDISTRLNPEIADLSPSGSPLNSDHARYRRSERGSRSDAVNELQASFEDPVMLGYVDPSEADMLVRLFHENLNPLIGILDPYLHSAPYMRKTSLILYTSVLAVSSKFFRKPIHSALMNHSRAMISRAIDTGRCETGVIQAILIMVYWKEPTDKSAWVKIGVAVRMAFQRGWHEHRDAELPNDELQARQMLDGERTWYCLICFDRQYADLFGLPSTIKMSDVDDCEAWARSHLHLNIPIDMHLACSVDNQVCDDFWSRVRRDHASISKPLLAVLLEDLRQGIVRHEKKWFGENGIARSTLTDKDRNLLHWFNLSEHLMVKHHQLTLTPSVEVDVVTSQCIELATHIVERLERVSQDGILSYLYDAGSCTLSNFGIIIYQIHRRLSDSQRAYAYSLLERARSCCIAAQSGQAEGAMTLCDRFFQRVLQIMRSAPVTADQPVNHAGVQPVVDIGDFDMDAFLRSTFGPQYDQMPVDNQYWSSLFPADP